jgi:hypothetical protein
MGRLENIKLRIEKNYEHQSSLMQLDIIFLVKYLEKLQVTSEKYWEAANTAELRVQELEELLERQALFLVGITKAENQEKRGAKK